MSKVFKSNTDLFNEWLGPKSNQVLTIKDDNVDHISLNIYYLYKSEITIPKTIKCLGEVLYLDINLSNFRNEIDISNLSELKSLKRISIDSGVLYYKNINVNDFKDITSLKSLTLSNYYIKDDCNLCNLSNLTNLEFLELREYNDNANILINSLPNLKTLVFFSRSNSNKYQSYNNDSVENLEINIANENCVHLGNLNGFFSLRSLKVESKEKFHKKSDYNNLAFLSEMVNLRTFNLTNIKISSLSTYLLELNMLETIIINSGNVVSIDHCVSQLPNLETLNLYNNLINKFPKKRKDDLVFYPKLINLEIGGNNLQSIKNITDIISLQYLSVKNNILLKIDPYISKLENLTYLDFSHNYISTIPEEICELTSLKSLYFNGGYTLKTRLPRRLDKLKSLQNFNFYICDSVNYLSDINTVPSCKLKINGFNISNIELNKSRSNNVSSNIGDIVVAGDVDVVAGDVEITNNNNDNNDNNDNELPISVRNPTTGRKIKVGAGTYKRLVKEGYSLVKINGNWIMHKYI